LSVPAKHSLIWVHVPSVVYPLGHVHTPLFRWGVAAGQLVHALEPAPLHVTQLESHVAHEVEVSA